MQGTFNYDWDTVRTAPIAPMASIDPSVHNVDPFFWVQVLTPYVQEQKVTTRKRVFIIERHSPLSEQPFPVRNGQGIRNIRDSHPMPGQTRRLGIDNIVDTREKYWEICKFFLIKQCEEAELLDYNAACKLQGLLNVSMEAVWLCKDPSYDPMDRHPVFHALVTELITKRAQAYVAAGAHYPLLIDEAIDQHRHFTKEWVRTHYKGLSNIVVSQAQTLVEKCLQAIPPSLARIPVDVLTRFFLRNPLISTQFCACLAWTIQHADIYKQSRNPSYKQMTNIADKAAQSYYALFRHLSELNWTSIWGRYPHDNDEEILFNVYFIDWFDIIGQHPFLHRAYKWLGGGGPRDPETAAWTIAAIGGVPLNQNPPAAPPAPPAPPAAPGAAGAAGGAPAPPIVPLVPAPAPAVVPAPAVLPAGGGGDNAGVDWRNSHRGHQFPVPRPSNKPVSNAARSGPRHRLPQRRPGPIVPLRQRPLDTANDTDDSNDS